MTVQDISEIKDRIIKTVSRLKDDGLYYLVFDVLTNNKTEVNYTSNSNGVFFNLNSISIERIKKLDEFILKFQDVKKKENEREKIITDIKTDMASLLKKNIEEYVENENCSTVINEDLGENTNVSEKKQHITDPKKQSNFVIGKTKNLKGSYARIDKILKNNMMKQEQNYKKHSDNDKECSESEEESVYESDSEIEDRESKKVNKKILEELFGDDSEDGDCDSVTGSKDIQES